MNSMLNIRIEKIALNMGCGVAHNIEHAKTILDNVSGANSVITKTKKRSTFNTPKNKPIGCRVTIRKDTKEMIKKLDLKQRKIN